MVENQYREYKCPETGLAGYQFYELIRLLCLPDETTRDRELRAEALKELQVYGSTEQQISSRIFQHIGQCSGCQEEYTLNYLLHEGLQLLQEKTLRERIMEEARRHARKIN